MESYFGSSSVRPSRSTKQALVEQLARRLNFQYARRSELILKTTLRCLCANLPEDRARALAETLPLGMKNWTRKKDLSAGGGLHDFLSIVKGSCRFGSMEDACCAAREVFSVLGRTINLVDLSKSLPEELRELVLQAKYRLG